MLQVRGGGPLSDAADHEPAVDAPEEALEVGILRGIGPDDRVLDPHADAGVYEPGHDVEAGVLVDAEVALVLQVEDEADARGVRDLPQARFEAGGVPGSPQGSAIAAGSGAGAAGPPGPWPARTTGRRWGRPVILRDSSHPAEQPSYSARVTIEERVAAVEESGEAAGRHVADEPVVLGEADGPPAGGAAGQGGTANTPQVVGRERCGFHRGFLGWILPRGCVCRRKPVDRGSERGVPPSERLGGEHEVRGGGAPSAPPPILRLKPELDRELDLPLGGPADPARRVGEHRGDGTESRGAERGAGVRESRVVQDVEGLDAQLVVDIAELGVLDERAVDVEVAGAASDVASGVAEGRGVLGHQLERRRVEPVVDRLVRSC